MVVMIMMMVGGDDDDDDDGGGDGADADAEDDGWFVFLCPLKPVSLTLD